MSKTGKVIKVVVIGGVCIGVVGYLGGADNTVTIAHTVAAGTGWGVGVGVSSVPDAVAGFQAGFQANGGSKSAILPPAGNPATPPKAATQPKTSTKTLKVPNCTKAQKAAAPGVCA